MKTIKANGGNGGRGQLGGDGDEGKKGKDGEDGKAPDTSGVGGKQTTIGFGKPGKPGGLGGSAGKTGRPGRFGKKGSINITHGKNIIDSNQFSSNDGKTADCVLSVKCSDYPKGGLGGEPGLYGLDQIKEKTNFYCKTKTTYGVVDRNNLIKKYPKWKNDIENSKTVSTKNYNCIWGLLFGMTGFLIGGLFGSKIDHKSSNAMYNYRNRDSNRNRGQDNNEESSLRNDDRMNQEEKRGERNVESLSQRFHDKKEESKEVSGEELHSECVDDLKIEVEELDESLTACKDEQENLACEKESIILRTSQKEGELEKTLQDITRLRNKILQVEGERESSIRKLIRNIEKSQDIRDKRSNEELNLNILLQTFDSYGTLGDTFNVNKCDLIRIIDEYLDLITARLRRNRGELKYLRKQLAKGNYDRNDIQKRLHQLQNERLSKVVMEVEIEEEQETEINEAHEFELEQEERMDIDIPIISSENKQKITKGPYIVKNINYEDIELNLRQLNEIKDILSQSLRDYRFS